MSSTEILKVSEIEGKGRGLVASQPLKAGQIILRDSPIVIYSALPLRRNNPQENNSLSSSPFRYCAHCFRTLGQNIGGGAPAAHICPSCSHPDDAIFCSAKCQSLAISSTHTPWTCQALKYLRNCPPLVEQQGDEVQVQARYLVAAYNLAMVDQSKFQKLLSLDGGSGDSRTACGEANTSVGFLHSVISSIPLPNGVTPPSVELTRELLAKDRCNAFGLMEPFCENGDRSVRAYGIYPNASFFNHDCLPNACRFDYVDSDAAIDGCNTEIVVRMIHDVAQGREICLSYFPVNLRYFDRQKRLLDDYGFVCDCDRCKVEANWSDKEDDFDEAMDEEDGDDDDEEQMEGYGGNEIEVDGNGDGDNEFPHAYFFVKYMCSKENCGGTLAPLPSNGVAASDVMECNVCGGLKKEDELQC